MCGIFAILQAAEDAETVRRQAIDIAKKIRHRGPDWSGVYCKGKDLICHERLAIVDPESGDQPLYARDDDSLILGVNGEIYNHVDLEIQCFGSREKAAEVMRTKSDCEVILHLYEKYGESFLEKVNICGMFAFVLLDTKNKKFLYARDHVGIIPLYHGRGKDGSFVVASEMKCMLETSFFDIFPPGCYYNGKDMKTYCVQDGDKNWFIEDDKKLALYPQPKTTKIELDALRTAFEKAVMSHLMSDVPYGVLLSGGLDSSLVAAVMARHCKKRIEDDERSDAYYPRLHSFCVGLENSPDKKAARQVAEFLGTVHHEFTFTIQEGLDALSDVIHHIETFDVTTVRASTPMFLMARKIRACGVKMVLSGEGADEIFGGYLYFHKAPSAQEFHEENVRKLHQLHGYDCLRANKSMMAWSVEARVPFLDRDFLNVAYSFDPTQKMCKDEASGAKRCEKYILRKAFDVADEPYLPKDVLWRQKEQFGDGVGYSWIDSIQDYAAKVVSDEELKNAPFRFPEKTPKTKEAYLYRQIFTRHFEQGGPSAIKTVAWQDSIACSSETALRWDAAFQKSIDPSGRSIMGVHVDAYNQEGNEGTATPGSSEKNKKHVEEGEPAAKRAKVAA